MRLEYPQRHGKEVGGTGYQRIHRTTLFISIEYLGESLNSEAACC